MATYIELFNLRNNSILKNRVSVAIIVAAENIRSDGSPPANQAVRLIWAKASFANPNQEADRMLWALLAANKSSTVSNITDASDAVIQTAVDAAVDIFADN